MAAGAKYCFAMEGGDGPGVVGYACNTGNNEELVFDPKTTSLCTKPSATATSLYRKPQFGTHCLDVVATNPSGGGGGSWSDVQIWAKPQPAGAVAVLVINTHASLNITVAFNATEIRYTHSGASTVLDIWSGKKTAAAAGSSSFNTGAIGPHGSVFYLISPQ
jgi:hypothetical protein